MAGPQANVLCIKKRILPSKDSNIPLCFLPILPRLHQRSELSSSKDKNEKSLLEDHRNLSLQGQMQRAEIIGKCSEATDAWSALSGNLLSS